MSRVDYIVAELVAGSSHVHQTWEYTRLAEARSRALAAARALRPDWCTARPVWCGGDCWHEHPDVPGGDPVGGYDVDDDGSAVVIFRVAP